MCGSEGYRPAAEVELLRSGRVYMKTAIDHINEEGKPDTQRLEFAVGDGSDFYLAANSGSLELAFMNVGGKVYAVCGNNSTYHQINFLEKTLLSAAGMDIDSMVKEVSSLRDDMGGAREFIGWEKVTDEDGSELTVAEFASQTGKRTKHYTRGDKLIKTEAFGENGQLNSVSHYEFVRPDVESVIHDPGEDGSLTEVGGMNFIRDLAAFMDEKV
ncbi:MAG: hypothetical protein K6C36_01185 [Clostridia bacterium]|nr:hypothetical protein [Clostridia bacterium]